MAIDKTKKFADLAYEYIRKLLIKPSKGGITSLPTDKEITNEMLQMFEKLRGAGFNVTNIGKEVKNADDLGFLLNRIDQAQLDQSKQFLDSAEALETIQYKLNNNIPLNPDDQKKLLGKGFKTASEAFQGFTPKVIQGGKKEGIEQLLKSGDVKKGVAPKTKPKDFNQEIRDLVAADEAAMGRAEDFKSFESRIKGMSSTDRVAERLKDLKGVDLSNLSGIEAQKIASEIIGRKGPFKTISNKGAKEVLGELDPIIKRADAEPDLGTKLKDFDGDPDAMAQGGIARLKMFMGGTPLRRLLEYLAGTSGKKGSKNLKEMKLDPMVKFFAEKQGFNPEADRIKYFEQVLESLKADKRLIQDLEPSSIKLPVENQANELFRKEFIDETQGGRFEGLTSDMIDKSILETETMIKNLKTKDRKLNAEGGRIGLKEGGGMTRRTFLKVLGGLASIPLVGKFLKPAAKATKAVEVASKSSGVPAYFPKLVEKIQLLGDDVTKVRATKEREVVKEYKGYELTEDLDTGRLTVKRDNYTSEEYLQFEPSGQYYDETRKKVIKYPDEYEEVTVKPDYEGKMKDVDYGLDNIDEIMREVDMIETDYKITPSGKTRDKKSGGGLAYMMGE
jgi:hypothetical protein